MFEHLLLTAVLLPLTLAQSSARSTAVDTTASSTLASSSPLSSTSATNVRPSDSVSTTSRDFSPSALSSLWNIVESLNPVTPPPFTTTRSPQLPIQTPDPPPPLYPVFYAPAPKDILPDLKFPAGYKFGVSTAALQVEGAVKVDGKGPSLWDFVSHSGLVTQNADITDLHYYLYKEDVARIAAIGLNAHSVSIAWTRILPFGFADSPINQAGLDHYLDVINFHVESGIEPIVTLFHWDIPLALLFDYGGFISPKIIDDFVNYAKIIFNEYKGLVKQWVTFNEPEPWCSIQSGINFTGATSTLNATYQCSYNLLKAHAAVYKLFHELGMDGEIAFKNSRFIGIPWRSNSTEDQEAVERHVALNLGIFSNPVYGSGDWPQLAKDTLSPDILPRFTQEEMNDLKGAADYYALDLYNIEKIRAPPEGIDACVSNPSNPLWPSCAVVVMDNGDGWAAGPFGDPNSPGSQATPDNIRFELKELMRRWKFDKIYTTEVGVGFPEPYESNKTDIFNIKEDVTRTNYLMTYLGEYLQAIHDDGIPLAGSLIWSMMDNFEWGSYLPRYGIQYVNYTTLERTYKRSAMSYSEFIESHKS